MGGADDPGGYANVYENTIVGATASQFAPQPDAADEEFAAAANQALADAVELLRRLIPSHQSAAAIIVDGDWSTVRKFFSLSPKYAAWADYRVPAKGIGIHDWLLREQGTVRLTQQELESHPAWRTFDGETDRHPPMRGWLATPLIDRDGVCWGLLQLSDRETGDYTTEDERALTSFTDLLALALQALWDRRNDRVARTPSDQ